MRKISKLLFALSFVIPSTFVYKGEETNYATKQVNAIYELANQNKSLAVSVKNPNGEYVNLAKRTVNQRGLARDTSYSIYNSKFTVDELPYYGHNFTGDKQALLTEMNDVISTSKSKFLQTGETTRYLGGLRLFGNGVLSDDIPAIDSTLSFPMDTHPYAAGIYAAPGEKIDLYIPVSFENELFSSYLPGLRFSIGATRNKANDGYDMGQSIFQDKYANGVNGLPKRFTTFLSSEIFSKENTVVIDGERYFHGAIASPVGGPVYFSSEHNKDMNISVRAKGGLESRLYYYGSTTDEENETNFANAKVPYADIIGPMYRLSTDVTNLASFTPNNIKYCAAWWDQLSNMSNYFNNATGRITMLFDWINIYSGDANAFISNHWARLDPSWLNIDYSTTIKSGGWGLIHEYNHIVARHQWKGDTTLWGMDVLSGINSFNRTGEFHNNTIIGFDYSLLTNVAKLRKDADNPFATSDSRNAISDPYSTVQQIYKNRFNRDTYLNHTWYLYLAVFHSLGLGIMQETGGNGIEWNSVEYTYNPNFKLTNADYLYEGLSLKSGLDFSSYIEGVLKVDITQSVKDNVQRRLAGRYGYADNSYPKFASTGSLYTRSNERVRDLEQWRKDIKDNVAKNGIPSYFSEEESLKSQTTTANFKPTKEFDLNTGSSNREDSEKAVYKRNTTGRPFVIDAFTNSTLNFSPKLDSNNNLTGRFASTEDVKNVTLEWQEGDALTKTGDYTYEVDPEKVTASKDGYDFAISVEYEDSSIPSEILYGTLETDQNAIQVKHYSGEGLNVDASNRFDPFERYNYDENNIKQKLIKSESTYSSNIGVSNVSDRSQGVLTTVNFDIHYSANTNFAIGISPKYGRAALVENLPDGTKKRVLLRDQGYTNTTDGNMTVQTTEAETRNYTLWLYTFPNQDNSVYLGYNVNSSWPQMPSSFFTAKGKSNVTQPEELIPSDIFYDPAFKTISENTKTEQYTKDQMSLISFGFFQKGYAVNDDTQDSKAFNYEHFTQYNEYDPNISQANKDLLALYRDALSDNNYKSGSQKASYFRYENMQNNFGALYWTYENKSNLPLNEIIIRDEQVFDNDASNYYKDNNANGVVGDVAIYVGDKLDENGSPVLSEYQLIKTDINNKTWYFKSGMVQSAWDKMKVANRTIDLDSPITNKYIVVKILNGQNYTGTKNGSFNLADIQFFNKFTLGDVYTDTALSNSNIQNFGGWQLVNDLSSAKRETLVGNKDAYLGFGFTGSKLTLNANQFEGSGKLKVVIDGTSYEVDTSKPELVSDNLVFSVNLENKEHVVTIQVLEGDVQLTGIGFDNNNFTEVSSSQIKEQIGIKEDKPTDPSNPDNGGGDNPNNNTNNTPTSKSIDMPLVVTISVVSGLILLVLALAIIMIVTSQKKKKI